MNNTNNAGMNLPTIIYSITNVYSDMGVRCGSPPEGFRVDCWRGDCLVRTMGTFQYFADALALANSAAARDAASVDAR